MTALENEGLEKGTHTLIVSGDVEYTDIFNDTWIFPYEFATGGKYGKAIRRGALSVSTKYNPERKKSTQ